VFGREYVPTERPWPPEQVPPVKVIDLIELDLYKLSDLG